MKALLAVSDPALPAQLSELGVAVLAAGSLEEGLAALEQDPSFAIVDEALPFAQDLVLAVRAELDGPDRDRLPVITLTNGSEPASADVRCRPDLSLNGADARQLLDAARGIIMRRARQRRLFDQALDLEVATRPEAVDKLLELVERLVARADYSDEEQVRLNTTVREAVGNAAEHGNKNDPARTIHFNWLRSPERIAVVVRDEGQGHDTAAFLARADQASPLEHTRSRRANEARPGGLGVFIMKETCDQIAFNAAGNSIFLMKFLPGCGPDSA